LIELTGKPEDTNSIAEPTRIAPVERALTGLSVTFDHTFPESSISVIEIHALPTE
jgi:alpha-N-arabinofuranosidase